MDNIRIGLIIAGIVVLVGLYLWERRAQAKCRVFPDETLDEKNHTDLQEFDGSIKNSHDSKNKLPVHSGFLVLYVNAPSGQFNGPDVRVSLTTQGLKFNPRQCVFEFHFESSNNHNSSVFSVANMVNPGVFPDQDLADFHTVGLAFMMVLPVPGDSQKAFAKMLQVANQVAGQLHGRLLDKHHSVLTKQGINAMRDKLNAAAHQVKIRQRLSG